MSHFSVIVAADDVDLALYPFDENKASKPFKDYVDLSSWWFSGVLQDEMPSYDPTDLLAVRDFYNARYAQDADSTDPFDPEPLHLEEGSHPRLFTWSTSNPHGHWDWYSVGGRWSGFFIAKEGAPITLGERGLSDDRPDSHPTLKGRTDSARKRDIDFDAMRAAAQEEATTLFHRATEVTKGLTPPPPFPEFSFSFPSPAAARDAWHTHPWINALRTAGLLGIFDDPVARFAKSQEDFVSQARLAACTPYALLLDDTWHARGEMGWFGMSSDSPDPLAWDTWVNATLDSLPEDTLLTLVDCHT